MKTQFNKASRTDKTLVTVNLSQFDDDADLSFSREWSHLNDVLILEIEGQSVFFRINRVRNGKAATATTYCFPRFLRLPQVGHPVFADVTMVS